MISQKTKRRYCGYCRQYYQQDLREWFAHVSMCEKLKGKWYKNACPQKEDNDESLPSGV